MATTDHMVAWRGNGRQILWYKLQPALSKGGLAGTHSDWLAEEKPAPAARGR